MTDDEAGKVIERVVRAQLSGTVIDAVNARPPSVLDPGKVVGLVRHIRNALTGGAADRFPIINYMSRQDAAKLKRAAA